MTSVAARVRATLPARGDARRRRRDRRRVQWPILAYVPAAMVLVGMRRRLGLPRPVTIPLAPAAPTEDWPKHANPWGSIPSDHFVGAATAALWLSRSGAGTAAIGWTYLLIVGFAVLYLGEHYAIDLVAALAVAEGARRAEPAVRPAVRAAPQVLRALVRA